MSAGPTPARPDPRPAPHRVVPDAPDSMTGTAAYTSQDYVALISSHWGLLLVLALVGGSAGVLISRMARPVYEADVTLVVAEPKTGDQQNGTMAVRDFAQLLQNHATAVATIRRFKLDEPPHSLGPEEFLLRGVRAEQIGPTNLLRLAVWLSDPKLAADVANDMASRARDLSRRLTEEESIQARDRLAGQLAESRARLDVVQRDLERTKTEGQLDLLKRDVETLLTQRKDLRELAVKIAGGRSALARAEAELGRRKRIDLLTRSIDGDTTLREAARDSGVPTVLGLSLKNEFVNQSYDELDGKVSTRRAELSGLEQERDQLVRVSGLDKPQLAKLSQLYALDTRVSRLEVELEVAKKVYVELAAHYEQIRTQVASRSATLQIIDPALVPSRPEPRYTTRNGALGSLGGVLLGLLIVFAKRTLSS